MTSHTLHGAAGVVLALGGAGSLVWAVTLALALYSLTGVCPVCIAALGTAVFGTLFAVVVALWTLLDGMAGVLASLEDGRQK